MSALRLQLWNSLITFTWTLSFAAAESARTTVFLLLIPSLPETKNEPLLPVTAVKRVPKLKAKLLMQAIKRIQDLMMMMQVRFLIFLNGNIRDSSAMYRANLRMHQWAMSVFLEFSTCMRTTQCGLPSLTSLASA